MTHTIIIGGGAIGLSVAYHLSCLGDTNVTLLERHQLTSGTSWHAAGIVGPLRATPNMTRLAMYAHECFTALEQKTGLSTGYKRSGGYWLARDPERMDELYRLASVGNHFGLHCEALNESETRNALPFLNLQEHAGGIHVAEDANVNPVDLCMAYAKAARDRGVRIREHCEVKKICTHHSHVTGVELSDGEVIDADSVALCAGAWSKPLAEAAGLSLPLQAVEHMYIVTEPLSSVHAQLPEPFPVIRDLDRGIYIKGDSGGKLVIGGFEPNAKCWDAFSDSGGQPFIELSEDWHQFEPFMNAALELMPQLNHTGIQRFMNGPESFTADTKPLVGQAPDVDGLFVAAGMNSVGVMSSAGIGRVLADWIVNGRAPMDLWEVDVARCDPLTAGTSHLQARMTEAVSDLFAMHWPYKQQTAGRNLRTSVLHERWQSLGAVFGVTGGLERGLWFARTDTEKNLPYSTGRQTWQSIAEREAAGLSDGVVLVDLAAFTRVDITGTDALRFLTQLVPANIAVDIGRVVYTTVLNEHGGIEADITVTRLANTVYRITSGGATRFRDLALLTRAARSYDVQVTDVTEHDVVLGVMGSAARSLLSSCSSDDSATTGEGDRGNSWDDFAFSSARVVTVCGIRCLATRLSYLGELGWELSVPVDHATTVFTALVDGGATPLGQHALNSCRIEKRFLHWGHDIGPDTTPLEAGLPWSIDWSKQFTGKEALLTQCDTGVKQLLTLFSVQGDPLLLHDEPIFFDNNVVGMTTSGTLGVRTGLSLAIGLVNLDALGLSVSAQSVSKLQSALAGASEGVASHTFEIEVAGKRFEARVLLKAAYDPTNQYARL